MLNLTRFLPDGSQTDRHSKNGRRAITMTAKHIQKDYHSIPHKNDDKDRLAKRRDRKTRGVVMRTISSCVLVLIFILAGCDEGGPFAPAPPPGQSLGGIWLGVDTNGNEVALISTESGRFRWFADTGEQGFGTGSVNGTAVILNYSQVAELGFTLFDGSVSADCTATGTLQERQTLTVTTNCTTDLDGTFSVFVSLTYQALYERNSSLALIAGNYNDDSLVLNINADGVMFGQSPVTVCVVNGLVSIIDRNFNLYDVLLGFSSCAERSEVLNGATFTGIATLDNTESPELLIVGVTAEPERVTLAITLALERL